MKADAQSSIVTPAASSGRVRGGVTGGVAAMLVFTATIVAIADT